MPPYLRKSRSVFETFNLIPRRIKYKLKSLANRVEPAPPGRRFAENNKGFYALTACARMESDSSTCRDDGPLSVFDRQSTILPARIRDDIIFSANDTTRHAVENGVIRRGKHVPAPITCFATRRAHGRRRPLLTRRDTITKLPYRVSKWKNPIAETNYAVIVPLADRPFSQTIFRGRSPRGYATM